jgi:hypothetical protein
VAGAFLIQRETIAAVHAEIGGRGHRGGEGLTRGGRVAEEVEKMAAEVVEAQPTGGLRPGLDLPLGAGERLATAPGELHLDEIRAGVRGDGGGEEKGKGGDHPERAPEGPALKPPI